jgi:hypothetical protein
MNKQLLIAILQPADVQDVYVMISMLQLELKVYKYSKQQNLSGRANLELTVYNYRFKYSKQQNLSGRANLELTVYNYRFSSLVTEESKLQHGQLNLSGYRS